MQQARVRSSNIFLNLFSTCSQLNHLVSGLIHITFALFILNFFTPTFGYNLSLLYKLTCWTLIQKVRYHILCSNRLLANFFSSFSIFLFKILFHLSFTVLVHYRSLILFRLSEWFRSLQTFFYIKRFTLKLNN